MYMLRRTCCNKFQSYFERFENISVGGGLYVQLPKT